MSEAIDVDISPLEFTVDVEQSIDEAFALFTERIGTWWPTQTHSIGEERVAEVVFEPRVGGRLIERLDDRTEYAWA
ncbi:MAG: ATPase, partial [Actinobacteria bacterium]